MTEIKYFAETEKAVKLRLTVDDFDLEQSKTREVWIPKSQLADDGKPSEWITAKKAEEFYNFYRNPSSYDTIWTDANGNEFYPSKTKKEIEYAANREAKRQDAMKNYEALVEFAKSKVKGIRKGMKKETILNKLIAAGVDCVEFCR